MSPSDIDARRSPARIALIGALLVAAAGVFTEFLSGVPGFPPVPPGPIILAVAAIVVAVVRWRWIPILGLLAAAFLTVGMLVAGTDGRLTAVTEPGPFIGTWLQLAGQVVALVAGVVAVVVAARTRRG